MTHGNYFYRRTQLLDGAADIVCMRIQLRKDQRLVLPWAQRTLLREGGILFADAPGFGKSYQALGLAQRMGLRPWIVAPRALVGMWRELLRTADMEGEVWSYGELWRRGMVQPEVSQPFERLCIVDEAHAFVNPTTRRYRALARLAVGVPLVLLSATPFQNSVEDGLHLFALFCGEATWLLHHPQRKEEGLQRLMARLSVRRSPPEQRKIAYKSYNVRAEQDAISAAAAALCVQEEPRALMLHGLLSRRLSSYSAWFSSIRRAAHYLLELEDAALHGRVLHRDIFGRTLVHGQRVFPFMLEDSPHKVADPQHIRDALKIVRHSARIVRSRRHPFPWRWLLSLPRPVLVFSQYRATVQEAYAHLRPHVRVIRWTGAGIHSNFPRTSNALDTQIRDAILLATDIGAEGIDLRACRTLVHADMHWNPTRTTQREGRIQRGDGGERATIWTPRYPSDLEGLWTLHARRSYKNQLIHRFSPRIVNATGVSNSAWVEDSPVDGYLHTLLRVVRELRYFAWRMDDPRCNHAWLQRLSHAHLLSAGANLWLEALCSSNDQEQREAQERLMRMTRRLLYPLERPSACKALQ